MSFLPMNFQLSPQKMHEDILKTAHNIACGTGILPISYYDLHIDEECFKEMEITPSPQMTVGYRVLLDDLVEKYNPTAVIKESELVNLI